MYRHTRYDAIKSLGKLEGFPLHPFPPPLMHARHAVLCGFAYTNTSDSLEASSSIFIYVCMHNCTCRKQKQNKNYDSIQFNLGCNMLPNPLVSFYQQISFPNTICPPNLIRECDRLKSFNDVICKPIQQVKSFQMVNYPPPSPLTLEQSSRHS